MYTLPNIVCDVAIDHGPVRPPTGVVFKTGPHLVTADGAKYVVKGRGEPLVVLAEALGYELAKRFDVLTPLWRLCRQESHLLFGSRYHDDCHPIEFWLRRDKIDKAAVGRLVALDVLLGNDDRNFFSMLVVPTTDDQHELSCVDFESSQLVRSPAPSITMMTPDAYLPKGDLRKALRPSAHQVMDAAVRVAKRANVEPSVQVVWDVGSMLGIDAPRLDTIVSAMRARASKLTGILGSLGGGF